jgi:hypothetical protein
MYKREMYNICVTLIWNNLGRISIFLNPGEPTRSI